MKPARDVFKSIMVSIMDAMILGLFAHEPPVPPPAPPKFNVYWKDEHERPHLKEIEAPDMREAWKAARMIPSFRTSNRKRIWQIADRRREAWEALYGS